MATTDSSSYPPDDRRPVVAVALRSAVGRAGGTLSAVRAEDLLAPVL
ncbi:MAG: acetyl-CoA C-acyltransferase, partial [Saccharothrix sp.]|nr:acetyl-CoA C-acyltransferase [Saccharothrix sp.]